MRAFLVRTFLSESRLRSPAFRYGYLAFLLVLFLLGFALSFHLPTSYPGGRFFGLIVPVMLLLNHLAFQFHWSQRATVAFRATAFAWTVGGTTYILFVFFSK
jgi:hypothetical protein